MVGETANDPATIRGVGAGHGVDSPPRKLVSIRRPDPSGRIMATLADWPGSGASAWLTDDGDAGAVGCPVMLDPHLEVVRCQLAEVAAVEVPARPR
jgi:hypothetical protein